MTVKDVETILQGTFADPEDRRYWVDRLAELKRKEQTAAENAANLRYKRRTVNYVCCDV